MTLSFLGAQSGELKKRFDTESIIGDKNGDNKKSNDVDAGSIHSI